VVESGTVTADPGQPTLSLAFTQPFRMAPVVMTTVLNANGADAVTGRPSRVSKSGFWFSLQEQASLAQDDANETISYIAWEPSSGTFDGLAFEVKRTIEVKREQFHTLPFRAAFADTPIFLADIQATGG
jgi:hypothetical protein